MLVSKTNYSLLAHRGLHSASYPPNSLEALELALVKGYGIETDLRLIDDEIVIQHDTFDKPLPLSLLLELWENTTNLELALNIKEDGLALILKEIFSKYEGRGDYFFFDMSTPQEVHYENLDLPIAYRVSDREPYSRFKTPPKRIWLDSFSDPQWFLTLPEQELKEILNRSYVISSELHKKDPTQLWNLLIHHSFKGICTDHPQLLSNKLSATHNFNLGSLAPEDTLNYQPNPYMGSIND